MNTTLYNTIAAELGLLAKLAELSACTDAAAKLALFAEVDTLDKLVTRTYGERSAAYRSAVSAETSAYVAELKATGQRHQSMFGKRAR